MGEPQRNITVASEILDLILDTDGPDAEAIRARFHRTMLWRYRTGRRTPHSNVLPTLTALSRGKIPMPAWFEKAPASKVSKGRV